MIKEASKLKALKDGARRYKDTVTGKRVSEAKANLAKTKETGRANQERAYEIAKANEGGIRGSVAHNQLTAYQNRHTMDSFIARQALNKAVSERDKARLLTAGSLAALGLGARSVMKGSKKPVSKGLLKKMKKNKGKVIAGGAGAAGLTALLAGNKKR